MGLAETLWSDFEGSFRQLTFLADKFQSGATGECSSVNHHLFLFQEFLDE